MILKKEIIVLFICASCALRKEGNVVTDPTHPYYELSSPYIKIPVIGDYYFHPLKAKYFKDVDKNFIHYLKSGLLHQRPVLLYAAHTFVEPYYAAVATLYKGVKLNTSLLHEIREQLKKDTRASYSTPDTIHTDYGMAIKVFYQVINPTTRIATFHTDYFINKASDLIRVSFWNTTSTEEAIKDETQQIIKKIKFQ